MSGAVGSYGGATEYGLLGQLAADAAGTQGRVDALTQQAASGYVSGAYAGLGSGARVSLDLTPEIARQAAVAAGINEAAGRVGVTQNALTDITQIAQTLYSQLDTLNGIESSQVDSVAEQARSSLVQVAGLLDSQDGGTYVLGGKDGSNPPVPSPDGILSSGFYTQINAAVSGLGADAAPVIASTLATAGSNAAGTTPFSAYLSTAAAASQDVRPTVQTGLGGASGSVAAGIAANANGYVASEGSSTTGSYTRDILRALATVGSLSGGQTGAAGFQALVADVRTSLGDAITAIGADAGALGNTQTELTGIATEAGQTQTALSAQVSDAQDADEAQVATQLSQAQTQLQASFQLIAGVSKLSLVDYL